MRRAGCYGAMTATSTRQALRLVEILRTCDVLGLRPKDYGSTQISGAEQHLAEWQHRRTSIGRTSITY